MYDLDPFDQDVLTIALWEGAVELSEFRYGHKLSNDVPPMSVASFSEELWIRKSSQ